MLLEALRYQDVYEHNAEERILEDMDRANDSKEKADKKQSRETLKDAIWDDWRSITGVARSTQTQARA